MKTPTTTTKDQQQQPLLGKYILGRLLGRGTFAKVYHARSTAAAASEVAIKVIDKSKLPSAASARVLSEVSAMRALKNHPNIVNLREVMATKTKIYLVMDYVQGGDLHSTLIRKGGRLSEPLARKYFAQLVATLRFCHSLGVAHRDVKPQNLLLDRDGSLKVSDFGLSALGDILSLRTACGTPAYTAPEVLARRGYDGARADAWSCGVILYVFIAGRLPFDDSNIGLMYQKIRRRGFGFPGWFPPQVRRVVLRLLDPNPETRIGLDVVAELAWLKRRASDVRCGGVGLGEEKAMMARYANAFDIIACSSGLDLSGLLCDGGRRRRRFAAVAACRAEVLVERVVEVGVRGGYVVERGSREGRGVGLGKGGVVVMEVEVVEFGEEKELLLVEVVVGGEMEEVCWEELREGLKDIVFAWQNG